MNYIYSKFKTLHLSRNFKRIMKILGAVGPPTSTSHLEFPESSQLVICGTKMVKLIWSHTQLPHTLSASSLKLTILTFRFYIRGSYPIVYRPHFLYMPISLNFNQTFSCERKGWGWCRWMPIIDAHVNEATLCGNTEFKKDLRLI